MSVVGSEPGMEARRVDADSSGAKDGVARLSVRPLRGVEPRLSEERGSVARAVDRRRAGTSAELRYHSLEIEILGIRRPQIAPEVTAAQPDHQSADNAGEAH